MRITISYVNALMSDTISNSYSREAHVNEQADVAMSDSVDPYSFHATCCTATAYFVVQI